MLCMDYARCLLLFVALEHDINLLHVLTRVAVDEVGCGHEAEGSAKWGAPFDDRSHKN